MLLKSVLIASLLWIVTDAARILGVFPYPSYSHQVVFRSITVELAQRGHEVTVFTTDPIKDPTLQNYTEIDLHYYYDTYHIDFHMKKLSGFWSILWNVYRTSNKIADWTLSHPVMQQFLSPNNTQKFDLIIVQALYNDALYGLSYHFDIPIIGISSLATLAIHHHTFGNPLSIASVPDILSELDENMNMWQRFLNIYYYTRQIIEYQFIQLPLQDEISRKYFGDSVPSVHEFSSKLSLLLINAHPFFNYPCANVPGIVYIGGCHLTLHKTQLPQDLEKILNDAKQGYVYFSLGSNVKSHNMPIKIRNMLLRVFAQLPYTVLWKFETNLENKPDNVIIRKWLPQEKVLAHPNIRLFIYQGGLQSSEEAIENMIPVIGFPIHSDQISNMKRLESYGAGKMLQFTESGIEILKETIIEMTTNSSYKENMRKLRNLLRDVPYNLTDNAIWWIEHVMRHKGAPHIRNKSRDMPWYQIELLDIMAAIFVIVILVIRIVIAIKRQIFKINKQLMLKIKTKLINKKQQ